MTRRGFVPGTWALATWLIAGICVAVAVIAWFGYYATREWRRSSELLIQSRVEQTADLLVRALLRDMRGAQESVLRPLLRDRVGLDEAYELGDLVASTFARYPYPEVFFAGTSTTAGEMVFFTRADRRPRWLPPDDATARFPIMTTRDAVVARHLLERLQSGAIHGHWFSAFETQLGGERYQGVARLVYRTATHDDLEGVLGFLVNLDWVRQSYFPELMDQVADVAGVRARISMAILDERGELVAGERSSEGPIVTRQLRPLFFDPALVALAHANDARPPVWTVQVSGVADPALAFSSQSANRTVAVTAAASLALGLGLLLTARATHASADLGKVRSDFVSSVTHELKAPLATIRAVGETLVRGRLSSPREIQEYAQILDQEAKRLTRLVDNLLAYSRVTDVSEVYSFESLAVVDLLDDALRGFQPQLMHQEFEVQVDIPPDLPPIHADRTAMGLVLDNLIDNALRYSGTSRWLEVKAWRDDQMMNLHISDRGIGIPPEEIGLVTQRFVRGRNVRSNGSGLGLAIASRIVTDHRGRLSIDSRVGAGTTVAVALPLVDL